MNDTGYKAAQLAELLKEEDDFEKAPAKWWSAVVDDKETLRLLNHYDSLLDEPIEETNLGQKIIEDCANEKVAKAVRYGNLSEMSAVRGFPYSDNTGGTRRLLELVGRINEGYIAYVYGDMGNGKTDFAILLAELWVKMNHEVEVGTNISSLREKDEEIERFEELQEWVREPGEKLFLFDEASSHASGYAVDAQQVTKYFRRLLRVFRKNGSNLVIIGHTGKDVHPDIRRLATDIIHKESKKRASVYNKIENGEPTEEKGELDGIEPTEWEFDTSEESRWFWES